MHELDGKTGASLKLSILNPKGRIWTMVAGGGASVIYAGSFQQTRNTQPRLVCIVWCIRCHLARLYTAAVSTKPLT